MTRTHATITAEVREQHGKGVARRLRASGKIPGVVYGQGQDSLSVSLDPLLLRKAMDPKLRYNTFFQVTITSEGKPDTVAPCIIADVQVNPIRDEIMHVDFLRVNPEAEVERRIPVRYTGRAVGVMAGGKLKTRLRDVRVAAKPGEIPVELVCDVTPLEEGQVMCIKDVSATGARLLENPDAIVAFVELAKKKDEKAEEETKK